MFQKEERNDALFLLSLVVEKLVLHRFKKN